MGNDSTVWRDGWPKEQGWYNCLVDGELEMQLKYYVCVVSRKPHWVDPEGNWLESFYKIQYGESTKHER